MVKVATCWDDGVITDLRLVEMFRKYNVKATFNLNPGVMGPERIQSYWIDNIEEYSRSYCGFRVGRLSRGDIAEVYQGFQVASHNMFHQKAGSIPDADFLKAALDARHILEDIVQHDCLGFAWPCGLTTPTTADLLRDAGFAYGRTTQYTDNVLDYEHPLMLKSNCHYLDRQFINKFEKAKAENGIFYFWGHSYEMMDCEGMWETMERRIKYISEDPETEWIDVVDIVKMK